MSRGSIEKTKVKDAIDKGKAEAMKEEINYIKFRSTYKGIERGTVIAPGRKIIWGFPHIKRIFTLEKGIKKNIKENVVFIEEKIDGSNIRIAKIKGSIYAFSRGGFLDYFATEKSRGLGLEKFFEEHPKYVLCGEMIGNTPYTKPTKKFDVKLLVFDIDDGHGNYLPCEMKYELLKKYNINSVPVLGKFSTDDFREIGKLVGQINRARKEGIVIKSEGRLDVVKYVNTNADIDDIKNCAHLYFDMPSGFFNQRVLRSSFFIRDYNLDREKYAKELGSAYINGLIKALDIVSSGRDIEEEFEILVNDANIWEKIRKHTGKEVKLTIIWKRKEGTKTRIRFTKTYLETTRKLRSYLNGKGITD